MGGLGRGGGGGGRGVGTAVVSGRAHLLSSFLCSPNLRPFGSRLRVEVAETCGGGGWGGEARGGSDRGPLGLRGSVPGCLPDHVAPPRSPARPRLCVGEQVPGLPRPSVRSPASLACCPGIPGGDGGGGGVGDDSVPSWGPGPRRSLCCAHPSHLGTWNRAPIGRIRCGAGEGARSPNPRRRDARVASSSAGRWRPGHPRDG